MKINSNQELICVDLNLEIKIRLLLFYRPPLETEQQDKDLFMVLSHQIQNKMAVTMGDFNCPAINWETVSSGRESGQLLNFYNENFLNQFVVEPTRGENILDIILATEEDLIKEVVIGNPLGTSDHSIVKLKVTIEKNIREKYYKKLNYKDTNWSRLMGKLNDLSINTNEDKDMSCDIFKEYFLNSQNELIQTIKDKKGGYKLV